MSLPTKWRSSMPPEASRDYEVGYGKPPRHTRFKKGQSGNPRGRPRDSKNLKTLLNDALDEPVVVTEEGRRRKITKREAIVTQLVNRPPICARSRSCSTPFATSKAAAGRNPPRPPASPRPTKR